LPAQRRFSALPLIKRENITSANKKGAGDFFSIGPYHVAGGCIKEFQHLNAPHTGVSFHWIGLDWAGSHPGRRTFAGCHPTYRKGTHYCPGPNICPEKAKASKQAQVAAKRRNPSLAARKVAFEDGNIVKTLN